MLITILLCVQCNRPALESSSRLAVQEEEKPMIIGMLCMNRVFCIWLGRFVRKMNRYDTILLGYPTGGLQFLCRLLLS